MNCKVMGIVNVTPDSFSDGGQYFKPEEAIRRARNLVAEGADIIDLGAESTRPGAVPIDWQTEWSRLEPVLQGLSPSARGLSPSTRGLSPFQLSVDTYHPETAERALDYGLTMINCVKVESAEEMIKIAEKGAISVVLPAKVLGTVPVSAAGTVPKNAGTVPIYLDPMIGFGTTREEDLELLKSLPELVKQGPVLVGASRKRIIKKLTGVKGAVGKSVGGNVALAVWCALKGASIVRVHDVRETVEALRVVKALE